MAASVARELDRFERATGDRVAAGDVEAATWAMAEPAPPIGSLRGADVERILRLVPDTMPYNFSGQPAIGLPLYWSRDGLPLGVQLVARYGGEDLLVRIASQLEEAQPWRDRRPAMHA